MTTQALPISRSTTSAVQSRYAEDWRLRGACSTENADAFFPEGQDKAEKEDYALRVCFSCPVLAQCREWALASNQDHGVVGGLTAEERRRIHRGRPRKTSSVDREAEYRVPDAEAVEAYLTGRVTDVHELDRLAAISAGAQKGMTYKDFDKLHNLGKHSTSTFVCRMRKDFEELDLEFPEVTTQSRSLSDEQVVEIRVRAATGRVTFKELAVEFGVHRSSVSAVVKGKMYRHLGGPISGGNLQLGCSQGRSDMEAAA